MIEFEKLLLFLIDDGKGGNSFHPSSNLKFKNCIVETLTKASNQKSSLINSPEITNNIRTAFGTSPIPLQPSRNGERIINLYQKPGIPSLQYELAPSDVSLTSLLDNSLRASHPSPGINLPSSES